MNLHVVHFPILPAHVEKAFGYRGRHWGLVNDAGDLLALYETEEIAQQRMLEHFQG